MYLLATLNETQKFQKSDYTREVIFFENENEREKLVEVLGEEKGIKMMPI